ncbi:MAG: GNAT family N-acetyltransferase [Candidatus Heimdallarchaeota archaeon]|nr:GNAT family N-acetyltransferase [Candidatus Heimdallarchaeota archaeon]
MEIIEIENLKNNFEMQKFFSLTKEIYEKDAIWHPENEEVIKQWFNFKTDANEIRTWPVIALDDEKEVLTRAVAILHSRAKNNKNQKVGWIGYFEAKKKQNDAVRKVLQYCQEIFQKNNVQGIIAPRIDNLQQGIQINGFHFPQTIMTNYNPPYYYDYFKRNGYKDYRKIITIIFTRESYTARDFQTKDIKIRHFNRQDLEKEIKIYHHLTNEIFSNRYDYIPRTFEETKNFVKSFLPFLDEELVIIAEDRNNNAIGYLICIPDYYQSEREEQIDRARIISIGVVPRYRKKKVAASMSSFLMRKLLEKGYQSLEGAIIMKANIPPQKLARKFGGKIGREYKLLRKKI